jgi:mono/diheme cytochrome c family protein
MRTRYLFVLSVIVLAACDGSTPRDQVGRLSAALQFPQVSHDVDAVRIDVVAAGGTCDDMALASKTLPLESEPLPASVAGPGSGMHQFADGLFVLPPGAYVVCATPLAMGAPSHDCARAQGTATVVASQTSEVLLVSQCQGSPNGGVDVVAGLNDPPQITGLAIDPSKFITVCQSATIAVTASDPNGDTLSYGWMASGGNLHPAGASATFSGPAGDYMITVTVTDVHAASATLAFPVHVSAATCQTSAAVQAIFNSRCASCHIANSAGGLNLGPDVAYGNLVGVHAVGAGCMDRVRVIAGDAATSYLIAKLRNIPPICGVQMPRNRPPLPEEEIQTIEAWINGLPH